MSEKIYAWLLRLYPSHFRKDYGGEALQLLRDRARNEKGFLPTIWLWLDLLADLVVSLPREYHYVQRAAIVAAAQPGSDNVPSFHVLKGESPRFAALLLGGVLSLVTLGALPIGISYFGNHLGFGSIFYGQPAITATGRSGGDTPLGDFESDLLPQQRSNSAAQLLEPSSSLNAGMIGAIKQNLKLDRAARRRVIAKIIEYLNRYYIDPDVAEKIADALQTHEKNGEYDAVTNGAAFADLLTRQMRDVSRDGQLIVIYSQITALDPPPRPTPEETAQYRREMEANNCTFETVRILPHNIGYLKLNSFPDASICRRTATAAMASLNDADAIIFDLRDNPGGYANMVALLATYLFDQPTHLNDFYNRGANSTEQSWTLPPVAGNRLTDE